MDDVNMSLDVKVVIVGCTDVGKTSLTMRYCHNSFSTPTSATIGASFLQKRLPLPSHQAGVMTLQIWDTAGQERFRSMAPMYYRHAKAAILVFDLTQEATLVKIREWLTDLRRHVDSDVVLALVGNKCDASSDEIAIETSEIQTFAADIGASVHFTSAKTGEGVDAVFHHVAMTFYEKQQRGTGQDSPDGSFALAMNPETRSRDSSRPRCCA